MRYQEVDTAWHPVIRNAVRSANRKLTFTLTDGPKQGDNLVKLNLSLGHVQTSVLLTSEELEQARDNTAAYQHLRHRIRRAMAFSFHQARSHSIFKSKTVRPGSESMSFFRPSGGRRRF